MKNQWRVFRSPLKLKRKAARENWTLEGEIHRLCESEGFDAKENVTATAVKGAKQTFHERKSPQGSTGQDKFCICGKPRQQVKMLVKTSEVFETSNIS